MRAASSRYVPSSFSPPLPLARFATLVDSCTKDYSAAAISGLVMKDSRCQEAVRGHFGPFSFLLAFVLANTLVARGLGTCCDRITYM